jgi:hypothetical protein
MCEYIRLPSFGSSAQTIAPIADSVMKSVRLPRCSLPQLLASGFPAGAT